MKTMKTRLMTRAMASPSNRSRTIATTSTRVTAADAPIAARPAISSGEAAGDSAQEGEERVEPDARGQDRLAAEAVGERAPDELGRAEADQVGDDDQLAVVFAQHTRGSAPIAGSAGIIASMAKALSAISPASSAIVSRGPGTWPGTGQSCAG